MVRSPSCGLWPWRDERDTSVSQYSVGSRAGRRTVMIEMVRSFWADESGQGLAEYAILITLIAILLLAALVLFRNAILNVFSKITSIIRGGT